MRKVKGRLRLKIVPDMNIKPIKTRKDYRAALKEVESLMSAIPGTDEGDRLDVLVTLVETYERIHFPMDLPDAVDAIEFRMEQQGLSVKDLEPVIGRRNRVYEILSRKRPASYCACVPIKRIYTTR